jgi:hypothetical protein
VLPVMSVLLVHNLLSLWGGDCRHSNSSILGKIMPTPFHMDSVLENEIVDLSIELVYKLLSLRRMNSENHTFAFISINNPEENQHIERVPLKSSTV